MGAFLYWAPGDQLPEGLEHLDGLRLTQAGVLRSPDGASKPGVVLADEAHLAGQRLGLYPDEQTWRRVPGCQAWVGFYRAARPTPADLQRPTLLAGHAVRLADGQEWIAPIARGCVDDEAELRCYVALPRRSELDDDGRWVPGPVAERYGKLWECAVRFWDAFVGAKPLATTPSDESGAPTSLSLEFTELHETATAALAANYWVSAPELALLGALDEGTAVAVCQALIDWPTIARWLEKKFPRPAAT
ncbi:MAG TPA: hypothetical protein P5255_09545 [Phycisphaerae bacterium]|nr:hypothetical protein [Phycisphaerae bacterium]HRT43125.1 hypothetical protein [Phycisphaerae bacterium]